MNEVKKQLEEAFQILSAIPVSGDHVEGMAAAKAKLRTAYLLVEKAEHENEEEADDGV